MDVLTQMPCWYVAIGVVWSGYQGVRGALEQHLVHATSQWKPWQKWLVLYIHDFAFRFICTMAGFVALYIAFAIAGDTTQLGTLSSGASALFVVLFLVGVIGIGGRLHHVMQMGKLPR